MCRSRAPSPQVHGSVSYEVPSYFRNIEAHSSSLVGGIISSRIKSHSTIFYALLPIAEQRVLERELKSAGQPVPHHVCHIISLHYILHVEGMSLTEPKQADCIQWILETSPKQNPWTAERVVHELMAIWFGSVHALSTVRSVCQDVPAFYLLITSDHHLRDPRSMLVPRVCETSPRGADGRIRRI